MEFQSLPEDCIAAVLSRTTPVDVCRVSSVSKIFCSAADSDAVWARFLPSDSHFSSIIDQELSIGEKEWEKVLHAWCQYWKWITMSDSRFPEVAQLRNVCWLEIRGMINTQALSPNTQYAAFLVLKMIGSRGFQNGRPAKLTVRDESGHSSTNIVYLDPNANGMPHDGVIGLQRPSVRSDGWLETEMGEFFNSSIEEDEQMHMSVLELGAYWKRGLFLEGMNTS